MKRLTLSLSAGLALLIMLAAFVSLKLWGASARGPFVLVIAPTAATPEVRMASVETISDAEDWHGDFVMVDFFAVDPAGRQALVSRDVLTIAMHQDGQSLGSFDFTKLGEAPNDLALARSNLEFLHGRRPGVGEGDSIARLRQLVAGNGRFSIWRKTGTSATKGGFLIIAAAHDEPARGLVAYLSFKH